MVEFVEQQQKSQPRFLDPKMCNLYAELLYVWTADCDTNKENAKIALKMYEKAIKMDQSLGWDIINSMLTLTSFCFYI